MIEHAESRTLPWSDDPQAAAERTRRRRRKAPVAAFLSFLFPGGGQLFNHQPRLAVLFAGPVFGLLGALAALALVTGSELLAALLDIRILIALLAADAALMLWRIAAMLQAHRRRARFRVNRAGTWVTAVLVVATLAMHAAPAALTLRLIDTIGSVARGGSEQTDPGDGERFAIMARPDGEPPPAPSEQPAMDRGERANILVVGIDSGPGRDHALTDTMLVLSVDPNGRSSMLSIPRDLVNAPLPDGESYPGKLNSLLQAANANPARFPDGGAAVLKATVSTLLSVPIHYFAAVDMAGFEYVIDSIGGVTVDVEPAVADPHLGLYLDAGETFMDGVQALTYVRSRHGAGNNDFVRAARQQQVLIAVQERLTESNVMDLPALLDAVEQTVATDVPAARVPELTRAIQHANLSELERAVIQPPDLVTPATGDDGAYILLPDIPAIQRLAAQLLTDP